MRATFHVSGGRFDGAHRATVIIDRQAGTVEVRPYRARKERTGIVTLAWVAEAVLWRAAKARAAAGRRRRRGRP